MDEATEQGTTGDLVTVERLPGIAVVTMNNPAKLNSIDHGPGSLAEALLTALDTADNDPNVRCVVLTGAGRAFSSGGAVSGLGQADALAWHRFLAANVAETDRIRAMRTPTIGAINGMCYGFGLIMATHLDLLVAVDTATFGLIETRIGSTGAQTLPFVVGAQWAKFLALTGEIISAETAQRIGLVLATFPAETFWGKVIDLARRIAAMPPEAVTLNRRVINGALIAMGWDSQRELSLALNTVTNLLAGEARASDGRRFADILAEEGWQGYKTARDGPFTPPWLE